MFLIPILITFSISLWLIYFDFKYYRLPNIGVLGVALMGVTFHLLTNTHLSMINTFIGAFFGFFFLLTIRYFANRKYKIETLGLGDVKLIFACGLWVGFPGVLYVISFGAFTSAIIGIATTLYKQKIKKEEISLRTTRLAAGPGFIIALLIVICLTLIGAQL